MVTTKKRTTEIEQLLLEYKKKYKERLPKALVEHLEELSWATIANLADEFRVKILRDTAELRRVQKELEMTRMILLDKLRFAARKEGVHLDAAFLKHLIDLLERAYRVSIQYEVDADSFMVLIALVIEKLKKEKLVVYDPKGRSFITVKKMRPSIREDLFTMPIEEELKTKLKKTRKTGPKSTRGTLKNTKSSKRSKKRKED